LQHDISHDHLLGATSHVHDDEIGRKSTECLKERKASIVGRPPEIPVIGGRQSANRTRAGEVAGRDGQFDHAFPEPQKRDAPTVMADITGTERRDEPARRPTERRNLEQRAGITGITCRRVVDDAARVRGPARRVMIHVVFRHDERSAAGQ
jgi:hypothetical protein